MKGLLKRDSQIEKREEADANAVEIARARVTRMHRGHAFLQVAQQRAIRTVLERMSSENKVKLCFTNLARKVRRELEVNVLTLMLLSPPILRLQRVTHASCWVHQRAKDSLSILTKANCTILQTGPLETAILKNQIDLIILYVNHSAFA